MWFASYCLCLLQSFVWGYVLCWGGKQWCDLLERGQVCWVGVGVFMAVGVLAGPRRSCWGIWCVHHLDGCFWRILRKCSTALLC